MSAPKRICVRQRVQIALRLIYLETFHQPAELLTGERSCLRCAPRPLVAAAGIEPLIIKHESVLVEVQGLDPVAAFTAEQEQGVAVRIQPEIPADDGTKTIYGLPHVGVVSHKVDLSHTGQFT